MKTIGKITFAFFITLILSLTFSSCVSDDIVGQAIGDDIFGDFIGNEVKFTVQFDNGDEFDFEGNIIPMILWKENDNGGRDLELATIVPFSYNSYDQAVFGINVFDVDDSGEYIINSDTGYINPYIYNSFDDDRPIYSAPMDFHIENGKVDIHKLTSSHSEGAFELDLYLEEAIGISEIYEDEHDNPDNIQKATVKGSVIVE